MTQPIEDHLLALLQEQEVSELLNVLDKPTVEALLGVVIAARDIVGALDVEKRSRAKERLEDASPTPMDLWFEGVEGVLIRRAFATLDGQNP